MTALKTITVIAGFLFALVVPLSEGLAGEDVLFVYKGKTYKKSDLGSEQQQLLHDVAMEHYDRVLLIIDSAIVDMHLQELAKKQGKSVAAVEKKTFTVKDPSEAELKAWYEQNKKRIPYPYEAIKKEVKKLLVGEQQKKMRDDLVQRLKKQGKLVAKVKEPTAPVHKLNPTGYPSKGNPKAGVTVVEFADYRCPHCREAHNMVTDVMKKYKEKVNFVFMHFALREASVAQTVAEGSYCAWEQNKFWEYHDLAWEKQSTLTKDSPIDFARQLKLDEKKFKVCQSSAKPARLASKAKEEGEKVGVHATPTFYINGVRMRGHSGQALEAAIEKAL